MTEANPDAVAVIGAGFGGLAAAMTLAAAGFQTVVFDAASAPGGKAREIDGVNAGPTVFTMKWAFDAVFGELGARTEDAVRLTRAHRLARHLWPGGEGFDLFADQQASADAIGRFAGARDAAGYRRFCAESAEVFALLRDRYIAAQRPGPLELSAALGPRGFALKPFSTLWSALARYFDDPRLRQTFGRYATYCGGSPFAATATLMLVAHVEQEGVWLPAEGMSGVARAMARAAERAGVRFEYDAPVAEIVHEGGAVRGVRLADGRRVPAGAVVFNGDVSALGAGLLGPRAGVEPVPARERSLSALTWVMRARAEGAPLAHHTVLFSDAYRREFEEIFRRGRPPETPTVYLCAPDRGDDAAAPQGPERLFALINAPANGDSRAYPPEEVERWLTQTMAQAARCGVTLTPQTAPQATTPTDFARMFPGTGGAIYGRAPHGWMSAFRRPGARTALKGLYLAGGSAHPGPGAPMATLSGRLAAQALMEDRASTPRFRPAAIAGGTSTG